MFGALGLELRVCMDGLCFLESYWVYAASTTLQVGDVFPIVISSYTGYVPKAEMVVPITGSLLATM